jgi:hypothetical protein
VSKAFDPVELTFNAAMPGDVGSDVLFESLVNRDKRDERYDSPVSVYYDAAAFTPSDLTRELLVNRAVVIKDVRGKLDGLVVPPKSVLDLDFSQVDFSQVKCLKRAFRPPRSITPRSLDPVGEISSFLLQCEKGSQHNWRQECTGTAGFYAILEGCMEYVLVPYTQNNVRLFRAWVNSGKTE